jgi:hypothetical protein
LNDLPLSILTANLWSQKVARQWTNFGTFPSW